MSQKFVSAAPKMVSFSQLPAVKNDTIFGGAETNFGPFLFCDCFTTLAEVGYFNDWSEKSDGFGILTEASVLFLCKIV